MGGRDRSSSVAPCTVVAVFFCVFIRYFFAFGCRCFSAFLRSISSEIFIVSQKVDGNGTVCSRFLRKECLCKNCQIGMKSGIAHLLLSFLSASVRCCVLEFDFRIFSLHRKVGIL